MDPLLARAIVGLQPILDRLVIVGGTAQRLFEEHPLAGVPPFELLTTEDVDVAVPQELGLRDRVQNREILDRLESAGFQERVTGGYHPAHSYHLANGEPGYLQFLAPHKGGGRRRFGDSGLSLRFSGIHAERLRHVELLLHAPWTLDLRGRGSRVPVHVVNPVAYIVQKLLVLPSRRDKCAKDILYIHDTLVLFDTALEELSRSSCGLLLPLRGRAPGELRRSVARYFHRVSDASREAANIAVAQGRGTLTARGLLRTCQAGLERLLGERLLPGP